LLYKTTDASSFGIGYVFFEEYSIGIYKLFYDGSQFHCQPFKEGINPVLTSKNITDTKARFVADPFLIYKEPYWYMFFEVLTVLRSGGVGLAISKDLIDWKYKGIVLKEPFHLSYPFVFQDNGKFYMIPESGLDKSVRLYEAVDFPYKWHFVKHLLKGRDYSDNTLINYGNKWWLFTSSSNSTNLYLYYSDNIGGPWIEHPMSPIVKDDANKARCGGNIIRLNEKLIRIAKDDFPEYGSTVCTFEIIKLNTEEYKEKELENNPLLEGSGSGWNSFGMHQLSAHKISDNEWIACVDGKRFKKEGCFYVRLPKSITQYLRSLKSLIFMRK